MKRSLVELLTCPARECGAADLSLNVEEAVTVTYRSGPAEEIRSGTLSCEACGRSYPVSEYVLSFEALFPDDLHEEEEYWGRWYGAFWEGGYRGFYDLRAPMSPLIAQGVGVPDPRSLNGEDLPGTHSQIAEDPRISGARRVLDVGCGGGWSSLYFARRGHEVIAFDPSAANMRRAKAHAIEQGEMVEYIAAGLGFLDFKPAVFDAVVALHSIHHVPDLGREVAILKEWLREGGVIAVDEHIATDPSLLGVWERMHEWFNREVAPRYAGELPGYGEAETPAGHSRFEDAGSAEMMDALVSNFRIETLQTRYVSLDIFSFMYYLWRDKDLQAYAYAGEAISLLYSFMAAAHPERVEYVTLIGRKHSASGAATPEIEAGLHYIMRTPDEAFSSLRAALPPEKWRDLDAMRASLDDAQHGAREEAEHLSEAVGAINELQSDVALLNSTIDAKNAHIARLEDLLTRGRGELEACDAALRRQSALLKQIEAGLVMRVLNRLTLRKRG